MAGEGGKPTLGPPQREDGLDSLLLKGLFTLKTLGTIARAIAASDRKVSPKGIGSGIRMVQFFINRAGKNLPPERKCRSLEKARAPPPGKTPDAEMTATGIVCPATPDFSQTLEFAKPEATTTRRRRSNARGAGRGNSARVASSRRGLQFL